jgi:L-ascorbate metabolism protein UlaG (beta-lactamase superfamily)
MSISIKLLEHAWFEIKFDSKIIYTDPVYFKKYKNKFSEDQPKADLILFTHFHGDHCKPSTLEKLVREDTVIIGPPKCKSKVKNNFQEIKPGEETSFDDIKIKAVDAYDIPAPDAEKIWHPKGEGVGFILTLQERKIYIAGDTDFIPEMCGLGKIDLALLPIGGNNFTMDIDEAVQAALAIHPRFVIPMHVLKQDPDDFKRKLESQSRTRVVVLKSGEIFHLR